MKLKDIVSLVILAVVLIVIGTFLVGHFSKSKQRSAQIEVVQPIDPTFDEHAQAVLRGQDSAIRVIDFAPPTKAGAGLGNKNLFGP